MSNIIAITSGKGGTGKTFFAANMGTLLAMKGFKVLVLDMDLGQRNLDLYLGLQDEVIYNLMDVISGVCPIKKALKQDKRLANLYLMPASPGRDTRDITSLHMTVLLEKLNKNYNFDYIIIDSPPGIGEGLEISALAADKIVIISEQDVAAMRDADVLRGELIKLDRKKPIFCVINKVMMELVHRKFMPELNVAASGFNTKILGFIQFDENIFLSTNKGIPIVLKSDSYITKNFDAIVNRIINS